MNGAPLPPAHGFPVRLIAPGWYGVANVKWLERIQVLPTRYEGRLMGRDYVTMRTEQHGSDSVTRFTLVGYALLKSAPARVVRTGSNYRILGAAWGQPVAGVEVSVDGGAWQVATLDEGVGAPFAWTLWSLPWDAPTACVVRTLIISRVGLDITFGTGRSRCHRDGDSLGMPIRRSGAWSQGDPAAWWHPSCGSPVWHSTRSDA
jgi:hypothetical protein